MARAGRKRLLTVCFAAAIVAQWTTSCRGTGTSSRTQKLNHGQAHTTTRERSASRGATGRWWSEHAAKATAQEVRHGASATESEDRAVQALDP